MNKTCLFLLLLFLAGCQSKDFVRAQKLQTMYKVMEISIWQSDRWIEGHRQPSNMKLIKRTIDPAQIDLVMNAFRSVEGCGCYPAVAGCHYLCFKDATGQINCTHLNVESECNRKVISGMCFIDESGRLFDALRAADLIPPCFVPKPMNPTDYPPLPPHPHK